jgi:hypothetical protein
MFVEIPRVRTRRRDGTIAIYLPKRTVPDDTAHGPQHGLSKIKRAELMARLAELDQLIEEQTAHVKFIGEMGWDVPVIAERLERLKESRQLYLSALKHLLGDSVGDGGTGSGG